MLSFFILKDLYLIIIYQKYNLTKDLKSYIYVLESKSLNNLNVNIVYSV